MEECFSGRHIRVTDGYLILCNSGFVFFPVAIREVGKGKVYCIKLVFLVNTYKEGRELIASFLLERDEGSELG